MLCYYSNVKLMFRKTTDSPSLPHSLTRIKN